jgi:hypothetical protein
MINSINIESHAAMKNTTKDNRQDDKEEDSSGKGHYTGVSSSGKDKLFSIIFYAISSLAVIFINKYILSVYDFPYFNFVAFLQFVSTSFIIGYLVLINRLDVPKISWSIFREVFPISLLFLGNVVCGLGSTRSLSLPMLTVC